MEWALSHPERVLKFFAHSFAGFIGPSLDEVTGRYDEFAHRFDDSSIGPPAHWFIKKNNYSDSVQHWRRIMEPDGVFRQEMLRGWVDIP